MKFLIGHREPRTIAKIIHVQPERPIRFQIDQMFVYQIGIRRLAVRSQTHDLILTGVDLESCVIGKRGIEQSKRVGKRQLP